MSVRRIASLLAAGTEIVYALGLGDSVVGISHECDYPPEVLDKPRITRTNIAAGATSRGIDDQVRAMTEAGRPLYEVDAELLAELAPDVIVTQSQCDVCAVSFSRVAAVIAQDRRLPSASVVSLNAASLEGLFEDIRRVGEAANCPDTARAYIGSLRDRVNKVERCAATIPPARRPRVACIEWVEPLMVAANWMPDLIEAAGGLSGLSRAGQHSASTPWERVAAYDPEVVVVMPCGFDLARAREEGVVLASLPGWGSLAAVRAGRVYAVDGNAYFNRSGPRLVDSLELLAGLLHPELLSPLRASFKNAWARLDGVGSWTQTPRVVS